MPTDSHRTIVRYLEREGQRPLEGYEDRFRKFTRLVSRFHALTPGLRILEVGIGTGWFPDRTRYWLRRTLEGPDIMSSGIDFHQFTYGNLRRALQEEGFSRVYDVADLLDPYRLNHPAWWKVALITAMRRSAILRHTL